MQFVLVKYYFGNSESIICYLFQEKFAVKPKLAEQSSLFTDWNRKRIFLVFGLIALLIFYRYFTISIQLLRIWLTEPSCFRCCNLKESQRRLPHGTGFGNIESPATGAWGGGGISNGEIFFGSESASDATPHLYRRQRNQHTSPIGDHMFPRPHGAAFGDVTFLVPYSIQFVQF